METLRDRIKRHEGGPHLRPYVCDAGYWTIGYGHYMSGGLKITNGMAEGLLDDDIHLAKFQFFSLCLEMNAARQDVCIEMIFWHGLRGFLGFKKTVQAIKKKDWDEAADEMMDSQSGENYPTRMQELADIMRIGENQ